MIMRLMSHESLSLSLNRKLISPPAMRRAGSRASLLLLRLLPSILLLRRDLVACSWQCSWQQRRRSLTVV
eukprot:COSAG05_NODE_895_length_6700_cov_14.354189_6_plen_70_part_00